MSSAAPACRQALLDATARWPGRRKDSDGIMGDASHQARHSDHNLGNAVDVSHDPASGCDGNVIAAFAIQDPRVTYVIFNRRIYNRARAAEGWRAYHGENAHTHHCHISIDARHREDTRHWGWASAGSQPATAPAAASHPTAVAPSHSTAAIVSHPTAAAPTHGVTSPGGAPVAIAAHAKPAGPRPTDDGASHAHPREPARVAFGSAFPGVELRRGSNGELVREVQEKLHTLDWEVEVDGLYGPRTENSVRSFQRRHSLDEDGIVGRHTWHALFA